MVGSKVARKVARTVARVSVLVLVASSAGNNTASALTAELAKKCREMMVGAHPPQPAGSSTGSAQQERSYFLACVDRAGKMDQPSTSTEGRGGK
jgi:hypothetical protein